MKKRFEPEIAGKGGWTEWIAPRMRGYNMGCCDCGLVHEIKLDVIKVEKRGAYVKGKRIKGVRVLMKARRNEKDTKMLRKRKK